MTIKKAGIILATILTFLGCNKLPTSKISKIDFYEGITNFRSLEVEQIQKLKSKTLNLKKMKSYLKKTVYQGNLSEFHIWKGGSYAVLMYFENTIVKAELAQQYGNFKILEGKYQGYYRILGENELKNRWKELFE